MFPPLEDHPPLKEPSTYNDLFKTPPHTPARDGALDNVQNEGWYFEADDPFF